MNEQEYILQNFCKAFNDYKNKKIVLYGIGKNTKYLLEHISDFRIEGLMDASTEGERVYKKKVLTVEETKQIADIIVIIARTSVLKIIYDRIKELEPQIPIYNASGVRLAELFEHNKIEYSLMPQKSQIIAMIDQYDTISFDLFDTLLMRKTLFPDDVFSLVAEEIVNIYDGHTYFKKLRKEAEEKANVLIEAPDIDLIYDEFCLLSSIGAEVAQRIKEIEQRIEREMICLRKEIFELYERAIKSNKRVLIISDMYWPSYIIEEWLTELGICGYEKIFVSCDYHKSKENGELYKVVVDEYGNRILHIGDNEVADYKVANKYGIDTFRVLSAYEMMVNSPLNYLLVNTNSIEDRLWTGYFASDALNSPFSFEDKRHLLSINSPQIMAEWCFYPLIFGFMKYLVGEIRGGKQDSIILFTARDGYLFKNLYDLTVKGREEYYPESIYFYTSRRSITVAGIKSDKDILAIINRIHYTDSKGGILKKHFGVNPNEDDIEAEDRVSLPNDLDILGSYIFSYKDEILKNAKCERDLYLEYMNSFGIGNRDIYVFDLACTGTVSRGIEKLLDRECTLICFSTFNIPNEFYSTHDLKRIRNYLGNCNEYDFSYFFMRYYKLLEILAAPNEGSFIRIRPDGNKEFSSEIINYSRYKIIDSIQKTITDLYKRDFQTRQGPSRKTADGFLRMIGSNYTCISEAIKRAFMYEDMSVNETLYEIWKYIV